jgi:hypothetical protein
MLRTTINLPFAVHHQLQLLARRRRTTVSDLVRVFIEKGLEAQKSERLDDSLKALKAIQGIAKGGKEDLSGHIDDLLYGEHGAWQGQPACGSAAD